MHNVVVGLSIRGSWWVVGAGRHWGSQDWCVLGKMGFIFLAWKMGFVGRRGGGVEISFFLFRILETDFV